MTKLKTGTTVNVNGRSYQWQRIGNGRHDLGNLHQRPFQATKCCFQVIGVTVPVHCNAEKTFTRQPRTNTRHRTRDTGIALHTAAK